MIQQVVLLAFIALLAFVFPQPIQAGDLAGMFRDLGSITAPNFRSPNNLISHLFGGSINTETSRSFPGILSLAIIFAGLLLLLMIIQGGFTMLTNPTNPEAQAQGKARITWGIVGFLVVFGTYWIAQILEVLFNVNIV